MVPTVAARAGSALSPHAQRHLDSVAELFNNATELSWAQRLYRDLLAHYYRLLIPADASVLEVGCGSGYLLSQLPNQNVTGIDLSTNQIEMARKRVPRGKFYVQPAENLTLDGTYDYIILSETINFAADVQRIFEQLLPLSHAGTRLILNYHSNLWYPMYQLATLLGLKPRQGQLNWLSPSDVKNLLFLGGWTTPIRETPRMLFPFKIFGLHDVFNRALAPLFPWACITNFCVTRREPPTGSQEYSVSVVIPARNEAGNIAAAIERTPMMGSRTEIIFIEGHSKDNTWDTICEVAKANPTMQIKTMRQTGKGKGNAVREAFAVATGDILMILDADLTMPPEELPKFYQVLASGQADFANGVRLVYPQRDQAMQFLNLCANKAFGILFSWILGQQLKDTLCGTKVLSRANYDRIIANRAYFGDFDPFGDFDLLFGADKLNMKIVDIPVRYQERTYGSTNIQRWSHGWLLARMVVFAARKLKFV